MIAKLKIRSREVINIKADFYEFGLEQCYLNANSGVRFTDLSNTNVNALELFCESFYGIQKEVLITAYKEGLRDE